MLFYEKLIHVIHVNEILLLKHLPNDNMFKIVSQLYKVVPQILGELG